MTERKQPIREVSLLAPQGGSPPAVRRAMRSVRLVQLVDKGLAVAPPPVQRDVVAQALEWEAIVGIKKLVVMPTGSEVAPPAVTVDKARAEPTLLSSYYDDVVGDCLERIGMLARHRCERAFGQRPRIEDRLLAQVDGLIEAGASPQKIVDWWELESEDDEDEDGYNSWAAVFALGLIDGGASLLAICDLLEGLSGQRPEHSVLLAEALLPSPHPHRHTLMRDLLSSGHAPSRATGIALAAQSGALQPERLLAELGTEEGPRLCAALCALSKVRERDIAQVAAPRLQELLGHDSSEVVWQAARVATLWGQRAAYYEVRELGPLFERLGERSLELLVMVGEPDDYQIVRHMLGQLPVTASLLDRLARFGDVRVADYLLQQLGGAELEDEAAAALCTLFGPLVQDSADMPAIAWREAIAAVSLGAGPRYRLGQPWSAKVVRGECLSLALSRLAIELRLDALQTQSATPHQLELAPFGVDLGALLT